MAEPSRDALSDTRRRLLRALDSLSLLILLAAAVRLVGYGLPAGHDAAAHALWGRTMAEGWAHGQLWPRWVDAADQGLGNPGLLYYPPLTAWLTAPLIVLGLDSSRALGAVALASLTLLALGCERLARRGRTDTALAGRLARLLVLGPYLAYNVAVRAALAETLGLALLTLLLLMIQRLGAALEAPFAKEGDPPPKLAVDVVFATLGLGLVGGLLLLAHPLTAALAAPLELAEGFRAGLHRRLAPVLVAALLAFGLSAGLWLPLTRERERVQYDRLFEGGAALRRQQALRLPTRAEPPLSRRRGRIALVQLALAAGVLGALALRRRDSAFDSRSFEARSANPRRDATRSIATDSLLSLGFLLLATSAAEPLTARVPWLAAAQYPWRHLGPATIAGALAFAAAFGAPVATDGGDGAIDNPRLVTPRRLATVLSLALSLGLAIHLMARGHPADPRLDEAASSPTLTPEYRPRGAPGPDERVGPRPRLRTLKGRAEPIGEAPGVRELRLGPRSAVELALHSDRGWTLERPAAAAAPDPPLGEVIRLDRSGPRLVVRSSLDSSATVRLVWRAPASARLGAAISALTAVLIVLTAALFRLFRESKLFRVSRNSDTHSDRLRPAIPRPPT